MLKHRSLSTTAMTFFLILASAGMAYAADASGAWKLATTGSETCNITLAADGTATGCTNITKWKARGTTLALYAANGDVVGLLKSKGDTYVGNHFGDNHAMTLSH